MKITELTIAPMSKWKDCGPDNPLRAVVKITSKNSVVECVLSDEAMRKMVELCADEIASNAKAQIDEFARSVLSIDGGKAKEMLGYD